MLGLFMCVVSLTEQSVAISEYIQPEQAVAFRGPLFHALQMFLQGRRITNKDPLLSKKKFKVFFKKKASLSILHRKTNTALRWPSMSSLSTVRSSQAESVNTVSVS